MRYAQIRKTDISDGPGIRVGIYVQGCSHRCKGCYNQTTWDFDNGGYEWTNDTTNLIIRLMSNEHIKGLSLLGGDPICCYLREDGDYILDLVKRLKEKYPDKSIWIWTGYTFEQLYNFTNKTSTKIQDKMKDLLEYIDVVVDGPYIESMKCRHKWYGSNNQRAIDVKSTINSNEITIYDC